MATDVNPPPSKKAKTDGEPRRGLVERLAAGESILCAEGYLLELARMGYLAHGVWVPEFILEAPEVLESVHKMFVHCGSDVTEAFQYYTHREKMKEIGREEDLEKINRIALQTAREVARATNTLFAGGVSQTNLYKEGNEKSEAAVRTMYREQVQWAKEEGVDYIICETLSYFGEAEIALDVVKSFGLPAVVTFAIPPQSSPEGEIKLLDDVLVEVACRKLLDQGATLVGTNCFRGLEGTLEVVKQILKECPPEKVCALPVAYRTTEEESTFFVLTDKQCPENNPAYPRGLEPFFVSCVEITKFTKDCVDLGLKYIGLCCGNSGTYTRAMAVAMGRSPPANRYHNPKHFGINPLVRKNELTGN